MRLSAYKIVDLTEGLTMMPRKSLVSVCLNCLGILLRGGWYGGGALRHFNSLQDRETL
jgi:hypothetical protein